MSCDEFGGEDPKWGPGQVVQRRRTGYYHHVVNRYRDVDDGHITYRIASPTHTGYEYIREEDAVYEYETAGFRIPVGLKPATVFGYRVEGILYGYNERPHEPVTDGGIDVTLNQLAGEYGVPVEARCVGCKRDDRDRVRVKLADPDVFPEDMADAGAESFKHVCHRCRKATYWNALEVIADVVLERVDELDEHDREVTEKVVRFLDKNGDERDERSTYVQAGGKPLAVATDGGERQ